MIDIFEIEARIQKIAESSGATLLRTGASEKSDAIYVNIRKPKERSKEYGVLDSWAVLVRVSNHFNDTNTHDRLSADLFLNIYRDDEAEMLLSDLADWLATTAAECVDVE